MAQTKTFIVNDIARKIQEIRKRLSEADPEVFDPRILALLNTQLEMAELLSLTLTPVEE